MSKLSQQLQAMQSSHTQPIRCDFCGGDNLNGRSYQNNPFEA